MSTARRDRWMAINFAATIFVSAFLLFQVQPLVSKYILPWFGGSPAVWTTCMLFFQTLLFGGYAYAHLSQRWLRPKTQALVHLVLIVISLALLRVIPSESWKPTDGNHPIIRILTLLTVGVGMPYFVLSSTGPLIQAWFARAFPERVPYRLYALSNFGSLLALLSYPFLVERLWALPRQATFWSCGFVAYAALCAYGAVSLWMLVRKQRAETGKPKAAAKEGSIAHPPWWHVGLWVLLPAFASVMLLATTNHVTNEVAPIPLLWVAPLSLYLLTFIIAFDHPRWYRPVLFALLTLVSVYCVAVGYAAGFDEVNVFGSGMLGSIWRTICKEWVYWRGFDEELHSPILEIHFAQYVALNLAAMFGICMLCHGELARLRPHPRHLTRYFLMIAGGGAMGGVAVTIVAPLVFATYRESKLGLIAGYALAMVLLVRWIVGFARKYNAVSRWRRLIWLAPIAGLILLLVASIGLFDLPNDLFETKEKPRMAVRNFFGTLSIYEYHADQPENHVFKLVHGKIAHGIQFAGSQKRFLPTTYYAESSGAGRVIEYFRQHANKGLRVGDVGLGVGTMAAYINKGDSIRFYEINPAVVEMAEPGRWFTYLKDCKERGGQCDIVMGDARLSLKHELQQKQPQHFQLLVSDAFNGDSIPVHLLTEEAIWIYLAHLATEEADGEDGAIAVHISNKHLNLEPVVRGAAEKFDLYQIPIDSIDDWDRGGLQSSWIVLTKNRKLAEALQKHAATPAGELPPAVNWTDDRSNLFDLLR